MTTELKETFVRLCGAARSNDAAGLAELFCLPEEMDEFEFSSFQDFLKQNEVAVKDVSWLKEPDGREEGPDFARLFYSYRPEKTTERISSEYTWFPFCRVPESGEWKVRSKGEYLRRLSRLKGWRSIEGERIVHRFDYSIKKSMDEILSLCAQDEYARLIRFIGEEEGADRLDYFVYDDEKSLPDVGFEAGSSGHDWVFSSSPCDLFQLSAQMVRRVNGSLPRFFLFGFSAYYAQFEAEGRYPVFNVSSDAFSGKVAEILGDIPVDKLTRFASNVEFDRWARYMAYFAIMSRLNVHPHTIMLLISSSFIKFLFESEEISLTADDRKEKVLRVIKNGTAEDFENVFKDVTGLKLRKAEKLWRRSLKKKLRS